jgi:hypothetical protein
MMDARLYQRSSRWAVAQSDCKLLLAGARFRCRDPACRDELSNPLDRSARNGKWTSIRGLVVILSTIGGGEKGTYYSYPQRQLNDDAAFSLAAAFEEI